MLSLMDFIEIIPVIIIAGLFVYVGYVKELLYKKSLIGRMARLSEEWEDYADFKLLTPIVEIVEVYNGTDIVVKARTVQEYSGGYTHKNITRLTVPIHFLKLLPNRLEEQRGGEQTQKATRNMRKMPRIFKYLLWTALVVLVWKVVLNIDVITAFLYNGALLHR